MRNAAKEASKNAVTDARGPNPSRLLLVEGVMGSGKSTLGRFLTRQLRLAGAPARSFVETRRGRSNPTDVLRAERDALPDPAAVWSRITPEALERASERRWRAFAENARAERHVSVFDGQLFGGDLTGLFLMDLDADAIDSYFRRTVEISAPLDPVLVYLRHSRPEEVLREIVRRRGARWAELQMGWKLASPFCRARGLGGLEGWLETYREFQDRTDRLYRLFEGSKVRVDDPHADWSGSQARVLGHLGLARRPDAWFRIWWWSKRGRFHVARALRQVG